MSASSFSQLVSVVTANVWRSARSVGRGVRSPRPALSTRCAKCERTWLAFSRTPLMLTSRLGEGVAGDQPVAELLVAGERVQRGGVQRDPPVPAVLAVQGHRGLVRVDVAVVGADGLAGPHPGRRDQAGQCLVGGRVQFRPQQAGGFHQRLDLLAGHDARAGRSRRPGTRSGGGTWCPGSSACR